MLADDPQALLRALGVTAPHEIDIEAIAQYCGATVMYEPLEGCEGRIIGFSNRAIITVNQRAAESRRRFSAAHELGHWLKHRGKVALVCDNDQLTCKWDGHDKEGVANRYAAELLLPQYLFQPLLKQRLLTFEAVRWLAKRFETSITATAIRAVQLTDGHAALICSSGQGRLWFELSPRAKEARCWPRRNLPIDSGAAALLKRDEEPGSPQAVDASVWFGGKNVSLQNIVEDTVRITAQCALSLLVWNSSHER
jgi:hypothetical protein